MDSNTRYVSKKTGPLLINNNKLQTMQLHAQVDTDKNVRKESKGKKKRETASECEGEIASFSHLLCLLCIYLRMHSMVTHILKGKAHTSKNLHATPLAHLISFFASLVIRPVLIIHTCLSIPKKGLKRRSWKKQE